MSGIAIFISSEGWTLANPSGSHRRAPFLTSPNKATPASITRTSTSRHATTANRGPSILAVSRSRRRLIIGFVLLERGSGFRRLARLAERRCGFRRLVGALAGQVQRFDGLVDGLAEQVVVEHLARDRGRRTRPEPGVLHQDRERDPRIVHRREGDEKRVVA